MDNVWLGKELSEGQAMSCEAEKYWQYSRECAKQALEAETPEVRDQLLELARVWTEAALCEEMNARRAGAAVARSPGARSDQLRAVTDGGQS